MAAELPGKTGQQCLHRYVKGLDPNIRHGKFELHEDQRIILAMLAYGVDKAKFNKVAQHVYKRTDTQCRERWVNFLQPGIKTGEWTEQEIATLKHYARVLGTSSWVKIAEHLPGRTDAAVARKCVLTI